MGELHEDRAHHDDRGELNDGSEPKVPPAQSVWQGARAVWRVIGFDCRLLPASAIGCRHEVAPTGWRLIPSSGHAAFRGRADTVLVGAPAVSAGATAWPAAVFNQVAVNSPLRSEKFWWRQNLSG